MITENAKLTYGLTYNGQTYYDYSLKPITLLQELAALDEIDAYATQTMTARHELVIHNLAYIAQMINIVGIDPQVITVEFLMNNLIAADYQNILDSNSLLQTKFSAAGQAEMAATAAQSQSLTS